MFNLRGLNKLYINIPISLMHTLHTHTMNKCQNYQTVNHQIKDHQSSSFASSSSDPSSAWIRSMVFSLKQPSPPWQAQNEVHAMLALWHPHRLDLHGVVLPQEHLIIFSMSSGARITPSATVVGVRDVDPSRRVYPWVRGSIFGGFRCRACFQMATWRCALATFSTNASFVGGRVFSFGAAPRLRETLLDHIFWRASVRDADSG